MNKWKILIIDDIPEMLESLKKTLDAPNNKIWIIEKSENVPVFLQEKEPDLIISDLMMPKLSGMQILKYTKKFCPHTPVILISGYGTVDRAVEAMKHGAFTFLEKPFTDDRLLVTVDKALEYRALLIEKIHHENTVSQDALSKIIGTSPTIEQIKSQLPRVASSNKSILITGETGTGKELIAKTIHLLSNRKNEAFVAINCSAIPGNLFESELFGHEKGAFTNAYQSKKGLVEEASNGTLFLDEIAELDFNLQAKLLRALDEKKIRHVGSTKDIDVDVRFIAATNQNPQDAIQMKTLRKDLFYRLSIFHFHLPPLRSRPEDIPLLAKFFLKTAAQNAQQQWHGISSSALKYLENYTWPGNIRELHNCMERASVLAPDRPVEIEDLPEHIQSQKDDIQFEMETDFTMSKDKLLVQFEKQYLMRQLKQFSGNVTQAAKESGLSRRTFYRMLQKYHISPELWRDM